MCWPVSSAIGHCGRGLALVTVFLAGACGQPPTPPAAPATPGDIRTFTGTWSFIGNRQLMQMESGDQAGIFSVKGSLLLRYVAMDYIFVSRLAQVLVLLGVFVDVGVQTGVPSHLLGFALLFATSYFSKLTPQGGSQNLIFVASDYLTQGKLYRLGLLTTVFCTLVFLLIGTPWVLWVG